MYLKPNKLAFLGLLMALDVLLVILSGVLEFNTLFLLAAASFCVGIAIRESNREIGFGFFLGSILLALILAPNKLYCITYGAMGFYLIIIEYSYGYLAKLKNNRNRVKLFWFIKYLVFNTIFLPILIFLPKLIFQGEINGMLLLLLILGGQVVLFIYDKAYDYFQGSIWEKFRGRFKL